MSNDIKALKFLRLVCSYYNYDMDEAKIELYLCYLRKKDICFNKLLDDVIKSCEKFPSIKKLLYLTAEADDFQLSNKVNALINETTTKARKYGHMQQKEFFENASFNEKRLVRAMGGYSNFCRIDMENPAIIKKCRDMAEYLLLSKENIENKMIGAKELKIELPIKTIDKAIEKQNPNKHK
jgi:hypothetical protein